MRAYLTFMTVSSGTARLCASVRVLRQPCSRGSVPERIATSPRFTWTVRLSILATSKALYRWTKTDGQVVKLNTGSASERLRGLLDFTSDENSLYLFGLNVVKVDKKGGPPLQLIPDVQGFDPAIETVILDKKYVYLNDQSEIRRVPISGGRIEVLAKRSGSLETNKFIGLAQDATTLYFFELNGDKPATLRSVPK
jgi:hypothetical protein